MPSIDLFHLKNAKDAQGRNKLSLKKLYVFFKPILSDITKNNKYFFITAGILSGFMFSYLHIETKQVYK